MSTIINIKSLGLFGVNVDKNPLELSDNELTKAQNAISDIQAGKSTIRKRPGLIPFNLTKTAGAVLGGVGVPLQDLSANGTHYIYIGKGPTS